MGLSGGVDSAVAALCLLQQGHAVVGATMRIWGGVRGAPAGGVRGACYGPEDDDLEAAAAVCRALGIAHHVLDCRAVYEAVVLEDFRREYGRGRTPNPCVRCNPLIKFGALLRAAEQAGIAFDRFGTGHYARIAHDPRSGRWTLQRAADRRKDQTYFLYRLTQAQLAQTLLPLGDWTKERVREAARAAGLPVHDREESQDFYAGDYSDLLGFADQPGDIVDTAGRVLGRHRGLWRHTVGQRRGLGLASTRPLYVVALDAVTNRVVVGEKADTLRAAFCVGDCCWVAVERLAAPREVSVKIRSTHTEIAAVIEPADGEAVQVRLAAPQEAVTPGQSAVFYDGETVVGGGIIDRVL
jgi:tRNA-specific 2-thiouridylase